mmetsp:Transcript_11515/g.33061  ORF Transcript_11515/g.33061 Transcript_11515/m.33061 type:complete len:409 (-) Transcript_11515:2363-3589(-)
MLGRQSESGGDDDRLLRLVHVRHAFLEQPSLVSIDGIPLLDRLAEPEGLVGLVAVVVVLRKVDGSMESAADPEQRLQRACQLIPAFELLRETLHGRAVGAGSFDGPGLQVAVINNALVICVNFVNEVLGEGPVGIPDLHGVGFVAVCRHVDVVGETTRCQLFVNGTGLEEVIVFPVLHDQLHELAGPHGGHVVAEAVGAEFGKGESSGEVEKERVAAHRLHEIVHRVVGAPQRVVDGCDVRLHGPMGLAQVAHPLVDLRIGCRHGRLCELPFIFGAIVDRENFGSGLAIQLDSKNFQLLELGIHLKQDDRCLEVAWLLPDFCQDVLIVGELRVVVRLGIRLMRILLQAYKVLVVHVEELVALGKSVEVDCVGTSRKVLDELWTELFRHILHGFDHDGVDAIQELAGEL